MTQIMMVLSIGMAAGILGGFFGVAGGVLIVPALVIMVAMPQQTAVGTSLAALLPPVGLFGALEYYKHGNVNFLYAMLLAAGLLVGAYFGSIFAVKISEETLRRSFAIFLALIAAKLFIK
jgi:uncharacterized membrane protein YfcA